MYVAHTMNYVTISTRTIGYILVDQAINGNTSNPLYIPEISGRDFVKRSLFIVLWQPV